MPRPMRQKKDEAEQRAQLQSMFDLFDDDGSGTISLRELMKELNAHGLGKDPKQRARLERHFEFMDKDRSGEVSFEEFVKATLGTANANAFDNLRDENDSDQFGTDLYMLLSRFRRAQLLKEHEEYSRRGETMNSFATMKKLFQTDMFTLNMGGVTRRRIEEDKDGKSKMSHLFRSSLTKLAQPFSNHYSNLSKQKSPGKPRRLPTLNSKERHQRRIDWLNNDNKILYYQPQSDRFVNTLLPSPIKSEPPAHTRSLKSGIDSASSPAMMTSKILNKSNSHLSPIRKAPQRREAKIISKGLVGKLR